MEKLTINGINQDGPSYFEAVGLSKVFAAYSEVSSYCIEFGGLYYNPLRGNVYISLKNGVSIVSHKGQKVEYMIRNDETGLDYYYNTFKEAVDNNNYNRIGD
jgi:hypothetical protein